MFKFFVIAVLVGLAAAEHIDHDAQIKSFVNDATPDGSFKYGFDTTNGIAVQAQGDAVHASGTAQWVSPEGIPVSITYVADENGYQASGDFVPKTPEYVLRALEWIKSHPYNDEYVQKVAPQKFY